jgi:hypothetical protein
MAALMAIRQWQNFSIAINNPPSKSNDPSIHHLQRGHPRLGRQRDLRANAVIEKLFCRLRRDCDRRCIGRSLGDRSMLFLLEGGWGLNFCEGIEGRSLELLYWLLIPPGIPFWGIIRKYYESKSSWQAKMERYENRPCTKLRIQISDNWHLGGLVYPLWRRWLP